MSTSGQTSTGYGLLPTAPTAHLIPKFDGNRQSFADFEFKLKAVAFDLGIEDLLLRLSVGTAQDVRMCHD